MTLSEGFGAGPGDEGPLTEGMGFRTRLLSSWPLAGRTKELDTVEGLLDATGSRAVFLFGPAGVGKTRIATELRVRAEMRGTATFRILGTATASGIPFAAVAHLLPHQPEPSLVKSTQGDTSNEAAFLVGSVQQSIRAHMDGQAIVFVDDAHLLDSLSATIVSALIANGDARVIATFRAGEQLHDGLATALRSGEAVRVDIGEVSEAEIDAVLHSVLGAAVDTKALVALRSKALGNMMYLRELVIGAVDSGSLSLSNNAWRLVGSLAPSARLHDLLAARLSNLSAGDQHAVSLLAVGGRVRVDMLERLVADADLADLEHRGIISVLEGHQTSLRQETPRHTEVMFGHPLFGEEILGQIPKLRLRSIRNELADAIEASDSQTSHDLLRVAVLRLDAGAQGNTRILERGARLARYAHDFSLTARLAEAAFDAEPTPELGLILGEALYETGRFDDAAVALRAALSLTIDERETIALGGQLLTVLFWGVADDEAAAELVAELADRLTMPECVGGLYAHRASLATFSGFPALGLQLLDFLPSFDDALAFCQISVTRSMTLSLTGDTDHGLANADRALELHAGFAQPILLPHPSLHVANGAFALLHGGAPARALGRAIAGYELATNDAMAVSLVWCQLVAGDSCLSLGRGVDALRHFETALHDAMRETFRGQVAMAWAGIAMTRARLGDVVGSRTAMTRSDAETSRIGSFELSMCAARASVMAVALDFGSAITELRRGAEIAARGGNVIGESWLLHELLRLGVAGVATRLATLAGTCDNALVHARSAHANSLADGDPTTLVATAERFFALGSPILGSEASTQASGLFRAAHDSRRANASALRAIAMLEGTDILPLTVASDPETLSLLTMLTIREREVAYLAAEGVSNKDISTRLFLSPRTVENHLAKAFVKLGVSSRQQLRSALQQNIRR